MNFYTSSSNKTSKFFVLIAVVTFLFANIVLDMFFYFYMDHKTNKKVFLDEKSSKVKHMKLQDLSDKLDFIFIGTSRTMYQISTSMFKKTGIQIYNLGLTGRGLVDYPYLTQEATFLKPKSIVISITIDKLYHGNIGKNDAITWKDLKFIFPFQSTLENMDTFLTYLKNQHLLFKYSDAINKRLKAFFNQHNSSLSQKEKPPLQKNEIQISPDCDLFASRRPSKKRFVGQCTNGDGIIIGSVLEEVKHDDIFEVPSLKYLSLLNKILDNIELNGIKPIVVFEPVFKQKYKYNIENIKHQIHAKIIDLTRVYFSDKYWADKEHLNVQGRTLYTDKLIDVLQK